MATYKGVEGLIDVLNANGVENVFFNAGDGQIEATVAQYRLEGQKAPRLVLCLHESAALSAAHASYMISGKPQVVMVSSELGTLQLGAGGHNAYWGRIPVILWAGQMAGPHRVNWKGEPFDQGLMLRNFVKWDHTLTPNEPVTEVLQKAFATALTEPRGPVYLVYPRGTSSAQVPKVEFSPATEHIGKTPLDLGKLREAADALIKAENPLIVAASTGRYHDSVDSLVQLAETLCAPVLTGQIYMNFPTSHPLWAGGEGAAGFPRRNAFIRNADAILALDYDTAYAAREQSLPNVKVIKIGPDEFTAGRPMWNRGADTFIKADDCREVIPALTRLISERLTPQRRAQLNERSERLKAEIEKQRADWRSKATSAAANKPISPDWLSRCVDEVIKDDDILVNFVISHWASPLEQIQRNKPGTLLTNAGGALQWALAAAVGAKISAPDKTVVCLLSDGGFMWATPVATLWTARAYKAPFLAVIFNSQSYGYHHIPGLEKFGERAIFEGGWSHKPQADFTLIARSCGAYGRLVEDPADVKPALKEGLRQVRRGRAAVLDVRVSAP